jgi:glycosyltransferase involved in cell wall biosynthesis
MLAVPFVVLDAAPLALFNPWSQILRTVAFLFRTPASVVLVQNPSLILTTIACAMMRLTRKRIIQDLHSYFSLHIHRGKGIRSKIYRALSLFCIRSATLTVVTNHELKRVVEDCGGRALVLQDAIPQFDATQTHAAVGYRRIVFVCTYSADEPVEEVFQAAARLQPDTHIYITGRIPPWMRDRVIPANVVLTGFLPESEYLALLQAVDAVMVLTMREHTLVCGAYEGLAFHKPLILSDKKALREYFGDAALYVENNAISIARGIEQVCAESKLSEQRIKEVVQRLRSHWQQAFADLDAAVSRAY